MRLLDDVLVLAAQFRNGRPPLSLPVDSLALVYADCAGSLTVAEYWTLQRTQI
jgi:hypothetical protein